MGVAWLDWTGLDSTRTETLKTAFGFARYPSVHQRGNLARRVPTMCHRALQTGPPMGASNGAILGLEDGSVSLVGLFGRGPGERFEPF